MLDLVQLLFMLVELLFEVQFEGAGAFSKPTRPRKQPLSEDWVRKSGLIVHP